MVQAKLVVVMQRSEPVGLALDESCARGAGLFTMIGGTRATERSLEDRVPVHVLSSVSDVDVLLVRLFALRERMARDGEPTAVGGPLPSFVNRLTKIK